MHGEKLSIMTPLEFFAAAYKFQSVENIHEAPTRSSPKRETL